MIATKKFAEDKKRPTGAERRGNRNAQTGVAEKSAEDRQRKT
nr:MAG TPA: hypothetical protein [Caudoviricetes sp.]